MNRPSRPYGELARGFNGYRQLLQTFAGANPLSLWLADDPVNASIVQDRTNNNNATITATVTFGQTGPGRQGFPQGALFDGVSGVLSAADAPTLRATGDMSLGMWVNTATPTRGMVIVSKGTNGQAGPFQFSVTGATKPLLAAGNGTTQDTFAATTGIGTSLWQFLIATNVGGTATVGGTVTHYLDGRFNGRGSLGATGVAVDTGNALMIGSRPNGTTLWNGALAGLFLINGMALNDYQVAQLYSVMQ